MKTYSIVGMNYIKTEAVVAALQPGHAVTLVREPTNEHDANAIAVWVDGQKVGFLPKKQNVALASFIDQQPTRSMAFDSMTGMKGDVHAIDAKFSRSPNSGYPMVTVDG